METCTYLIVGSSHAALEAADAIRAQQPEGRLILASRDRDLPYSPTVLPYVVSGQSPADGVALRAPGALEARGIELQLNRELTAIDAEQHIASFADGSQIQYAKLLLATGASPALPPVAGLDSVPYLVLRTLQDAVALRDALKQAKRAIVLGAGLIGMHAAENLVRAGAAVTIIEMADRVLPAYFPPQASEKIAEAFTQGGVMLQLGRRVTAVSGSQTIQAELDDGSTVEGDLLLVATGVAPNMAFAAGCGLQTDQGILVDEQMRTNLPDIWAAGDVAQARDLLAGERRVNGILPNAVEQGRIAGMGMVDDPYLKPFSGGVALNTYHFFGHHAVAVGNPSTDDAGTEIHESNGSGYRRIALRNDRLVGIAAIDQPLDAGVMWQLMLRDTDLGPVKAAFLADPLTTGRQLMATTWG